MQRKGFWRIYETENNALQNQLIRFNSYNILQHVLSKVESNGSTYSFKWNQDDGSVEVSTNGENNPRWLTFFSSADSLPYGMKAGETYYCSNDGENAYLVIYNYLGSSFPELLRLNSGKNVKVKIPNDCTGLLIRAWVPRSTATTETIHPVISRTVSNEDIVGPTTELLHYRNTYTYGDANEFDERGYTFVSYQESHPGNWVNVPQEDNAGTLINLNSDTGYNIKTQIWIPYSGSQGWKHNLANSYIRRSNINSTWTTWERLFDLSHIYAATPTSKDANDIISGACFVSLDGELTITSNLPHNRPQWIVPIPTYTKNFIFQFSFPYDTSQKIYYRIKNTQWNSWTAIDSGSTTTIVQEVSRDTYNNTYNITTSPQITTDTNGWLQSVDTNTADESNKTDMTGAIMSMLNSTGYCHLGPGIFYVSGNINMPADSMIEGCGKQTIVRLLQSTTSGYIVRMHTRSTIKNVCFSGSYNAGDISNVNIGGRRGINYIGNRDGQNPEVTPSTCTLCMIEGCWFENLDSGIYGYNAGGGLQNGLEVSNCYFTRCKAGINIDYWTEYCKFTNCVTFQCYYACINNGGNNVFTACTFHGVIGFLIDNSADNKTNNAHGSCVGCTFNHIDNMNNPSELGKGIAIKVLNTIAGFLFANCQLWYGRIYIESSKGIQITGCEIGGLGGSEYPVLETTGSYMVFVDNCLFQNTPTKSTSSPTKFTNCWTYDGVAVTS